MKKLKDITEAAKWHIKHKNDSDVVYHSSPTNDTQRFHPLTHFGTQRAARARASEVRDLEGLDINHEYHHYAVRLRLGNVAHIEDSAEHSPLDILHGLHSAGHITKNEKNQAERDMERANNGTHPIHPHDHDVLMGLLKKKNIHTLSYTNHHEHRGSTSYMITDPKQVRILKHGKSKLNLKRGNKDLS
jgi:hypothetical protein